MDQQTNIILAGSDSLVLDELKSLVTAKPRYRLSSVLLNWDDCFKQFADSSSATLLLDIDLIPQGCFDNLKSLISAKSRPKIIVLTNNAENGTVFRLMKTGLKSCILKEQISRDLEDALESLENTSFFLSNELLNSFFDCFNKIEEELEGDSSIDFSVLSKRETEVMVELMQGFSNELICQKLFISPNTLKTHLKNIFSKLDVHSKIELVLAAQKSDFLRQVKTSAMIEA